MIVNNKLSFFSDALGHSALTGIGIGVLLGADNYMLSMIGFALSFALCITGIIQSETASSDTIIGVFSAVELHWELYCFRRMEGSRNIPII